MKGKLQGGDQLWLMTDALSCWFLTEVEAGRQPWRELLPLVGSADAAVFADWVDRLRAARKLRNDDTTLVAVLPRR